MKTFSFGALERQAHSTYVVRCLRVVSEGRSAGEAVEVGEPVVVGSKEHKAKKPCALAPHFEGRRCKVSYESKYVNVLTLVWRLNARD